MYTNSEIKALIEEHIHSKEHRKILYRRLVDGCTYAELSEEFNYSVRHIQRIVYKEQEELFKYLKP